MLEHFHATRSDSISAFLLNATYRLIPHIILHQFWLDFTRHYWIMGNTNRLEKCMDRACVREERQAQTGKLPTLTPLLASGLQASRTRRSQQCNGPFWQTEYPYWQQVWLPKETLLQDPAHRKNSSDSFQILGRRPVCGHTARFWENLRQCFIIIITIIIIIITTTIFIILIIIINIIIIIIYLFIYLFQCPCTR